jgi:heme exporter protein C
VLLIAAGLWSAFTAPLEAYQGQAGQGVRVRIMYVHVPAAWTAMAAYGALGVSSFFSYVFRHALADAAARAVAPIGIAFTLMALATGSLWGCTTWNTCWAWDARVTSFFILLLLFVGYIALRSAIEDEGRAARAAAILAMAGLLDLPVIKFSVDCNRLICFNTLHQGESIFRADGPSIDVAFLIPLGIMTLGYTFAFLALWMERIRAEVWRRRVRVQEAQAGA